MPKVLIITYYWPPAGGPGVQRTLKFCKYLHEFGWDPIVLTVKSGNYPAKDESLEKDIPRGMIVHRSSSFEPFRLYNILKGKKPDSSIPTHVLSSSTKETYSQKLFKWIRSNLFLPDARVGWVPFLIKEGRKLIRLYEPDLIFSSSPPHSLQLGACRLSKESGIPLVADLRDPWTEGFWLKHLPRSRISWCIDKRFEKLLLRDARVITTVSQGLKEIYSNNTNQPIRVIENGYDEADFSGIRKGINSKFTICHSGNIRTAQFSPEFFDSISSLSKELRDRVELHFYGHVHKDIIDYVNQSPGANCYHFHGYVSHSEVINRIVNADVLVLFSTNTENSKGVLTAKVFEYIRTGNYIIGYGRAGNEIRDLLDETGCGSFYEFGTHCENKIKELLTLWKEDRLPFYGNNKVKKYSRRNLTKRLAALFDELLKVEQENLNDCK